MAGKKGLSFEEKRTKMLEIFHDSVTNLRSFLSQLIQFKREFYQLKELEKICPKQKV